MSFHTLLVIFPTLISSTALYLSIRAIRDSRWDRFLVTIDGEFPSAAGRDEGSYVSIKIEITNVGRVPVTVTDVYLEISDKRETWTPEFDRAKAVFHGASQVSYWSEQLPMVIQPNSSYRFHAKDIRDTDNTDLFARPGATFIRRPSSPKRVTHTSTRTNVFGQVIEYPQTKFRRSLKSDKRTT